MSGRGKRERKRRENERNEGHIANQSPNFYSQKTNQIQKLIILKVQEQIKKL